MRRIVASLLVALVIATGCTGDDPLTADAAAVVAGETAEQPADAEEAAEPAQEPSETDAADPDGPSAEAPADAVEGGELDLTSRIRSLGSALYDEEALFAADGPAPVALEIPGIGVVETPVRPVGVEPSGEMEIPGAREVGWYRFGPTPGAAGSAVLAAHIAFDGVDGVFRDLLEIEPGTRLTVRYDDGTSAEFEVVERAQYAKDELPFDRIFARDGEPELALITCGGEFNPTLRSYADNIVAYAVPV